jgi:hypothetical protein
VPCLFWPIAWYVQRAVDAVGSNFNSTGNLNNWWTAITKDSYSVRRQCLVSETSETQSLDSILRYQAAIQLAYRAWIYRLEENKGSPVDVLPGQLYDLGPEQLLYITGAQGQCHHPPSWLNIASQRDIAHALIFGLRIANFKLKTINIFCTHDSRMNDL